MTTTAQRTFINDKCNAVIAKAAGDNKDALNYLNIIYFLTRVIDDVVDNDREVKHDDYFIAMQDLLVNIHMNPFFRENYDMLVSQHITIWNTWLAANKFEKEGELIDRLHARTWRLYVDELLPLVAYLTQGFDAMKAVDEEIRAFTAFYNRMDPPDFDLHELENVIQ